MIKGLAATMDTFMTLMMSFVLFVTFGFLGTFVNGWFFFANAFLIVYLLFFIPARNKALQMEEIFESDSKNSGPKPSH
jgi:hypothetical protein